MVTEPSEWLKIRITGRVLKKFRLKDLVLKLVSLIFMSIHFSRVEGKKLNPIGYRSINWTQWFQNVQGGEWAPKMMMPTPPPRLYCGFGIKIPEGHKKYEEFRVSRESRKERKNASVHSCHDIRIM